MKVLRFCGFVIAEVICLCAIYIGAMMRHWTVVEVSVGCAVIAYGFYSAADACCDIQMFEMLKGEKENGSQSGQCEG